LVEKYPIFFILHGMKTPALLLTSLLFACSLRAQTKIFKEVGEDIATQVKSITQDNALIGYLAFTRLEKASEDSFNYRLTIMDENLNDIGSVKFRGGILDLQAVSFEQNVLCLGYIESAMAGKPAKSRQDYGKVRDAAASSHILLQFINLDGKVINTYQCDVALSIEMNPAKRPSAMTMLGYLKYGMQIRNITNSGFAFFYGDEAKQKLLAFDINGNKTHEQAAPLVADHYYLRAAGEDVYLLTKQDLRIPEGNFKIFVFSAKDLEAENNFDLRDRYDNWLKVLSFDNDPVTGDAFIAGCIINPRRETHFLTANDYAYGPYLGLFTLDLGNAHKDMTANCSYWSTEHVPGISATGFFTDKGFFVKYATAFRDYKGNTIFAGTALLGEGYVGAAKYRLADGVFVRQEASGNIALDNDIPCDETKNFGDAGILLELDKKDFYKVDNPDVRTNYVIIDDEANIYIYNVTGKKVMRTIPHKDGNLKINVYPAKEGHMMVSEYNRKEKYTRFSIEAL
jgi:hypothetical protein